MPSDKGSSKSDIPTLLLYLEGPHDAYCRV